ncbi:NADPH:quinone oxidoreductase family protein [Falsiroseomonas selenitidurans]|uniref:NADPH:quinone oxidoreductase family protein n=1 Tax=Falsiroseomonas selenitidurans TaxID=2716335 RepID=A0ABX1E908_9PROT|nr:NADPH:quinone oxidoreductase family protein [Falsiroseomonas selenitidurans]NKC31390.1 NADPH:quinone oxidoreductase family protein [Falsiroseomonas selenitidurans]
MKAARVSAFGGPEAVQMAALDRPQPGPGEVLVRVQAVSVNYVDLVVIAGRYQFLPKLPFTPGKGPAGTIAALGEGVTGWAVGDRVLAMAEIGSYAEYTPAPANQCYRLPDAMPFTEAAALALAYDTAWFALRERARFQPGETVLVLGATGAVGLAAVALARALGGRVLAGVSSPAKAQLALDAGAEAIIDLSAPDIRESLRAQVRDATGGGAADIVIDPLGDVYFEAALRALAWRGRLVVVGFAAGAIPSVKANYLLVKNIEVSGLQISDYRKRVPQDVAACFAEIFSLYERGLVTPAPATVMPLEQVSQALALLRDRAVAGRIVLTP